MRLPTVIALAAFATALHAQTPQFAGRYVTADQSGGPVVLVLQQANGGSVTGTLTGGTATLTLSGVPQEGALLGTVTGPGVGLYFAAELQGAALTLTLFEAGPDNQPNYDRSQTIAFTRDAGAGLGAAPGAPAPVMGAAAGPASGAPPAARGQRQTIDHWNLSYAMPSGWQLAQQVGRLHTLSAGGQGAAIYVAAGMYQNFNDVGTDLSKGFTALGLTGMPMGQPTPSTIQGMQAMTADYMGQNQMGMPFQARAVAVLTAHGTGLVVTGIAPQQQMGQVGPAVDAIAQTLRVIGPPQPNRQAIAALRGRWMYYAGRAQGVTSATGGASRSHEEFVEFDGQGNFTYQSSSSVSVTTPGLTGNAGGAQATSDAGTYTVIGNTLIVRGRSGQSSFDLQMAADRIVADGRTYLRAN